MSTQNPDLQSPLLAQVAALGDRYHEWVYRPAQVRGGVRLFRSNFLETFSHTPWWLVPILWIPAATALIVLASTRFGMRPVTAVGHVSTGVLLWGLIEYLMHRFLFHYRPTTAFGRRLHFLGHGVHHLNPGDPLRLVFPPVPAAAIGLVIFGGLEWVAPTASALTLMAGIVLGYVTYDMTHFFTHHAKPKTRVGRFLQRYHLAHHFQNQDTRFGVSQPLFDKLFGTYRAP